MATSVNHSFMPSPAPSARMFEELNHAVHERRPFSTVKISRILSTVFKKRVCHRLDQRRVLVDFEANGEKSCPETGNSSKEEEECYDPYTQIMIHVSGSFWREPSEQAFSLAAGKANG